MVVSANVGKMLVCVTVSKNSMISCKTLVNVKDSVDTAIETGACAVEVIVVVPVVTVSEFKSAVKVTMEDKSESIMLTMVVGMETCTETNNGSTAMANSASFVQRAYVAADVSQLFAPVKNDSNPVAVMRQQPALKVTP